jgi:hypothetical protein
LGGWAGLRWAAWCLAGWCPTAVRGLLLCCRRPAGDGGRSWCGVCLMSGQADRGAGEDGGQDSGDGDAGSVGAHRAGWRRGGRWLHQPQVGGGDAGGGAEACLFAQLDSSLQVQLRGVEFVVAQCPGALLVTEERFGGGVADEAGGVDAHVEDVLPGFPAAGQGEDGLNGADEADHRGPFAPFGGEFDQGERGVERREGIGAGWVAGGKPADELAGGRAGLQIFEEDVPVAGGVADRQAEPVVVLFGQAVMAQPAQMLGDVGDVAHDGAEVGGDQSAGRHGQEGQDLSFRFGDAADAQPVEPVRVPLGYAGELAERVLAGAGQGRGLLQV